MDERLKEDFIMYLWNAARNRVSYPRGHPIISRSLDRTFEMLEQLLAASGELKIAVVGEDVVVDGAPLEETSGVEAFIKNLRLREIEWVKFIKGMNEQELSELVEVLSMGVEKLKESGGPINILTSRAVKNIVLGKIGSPEQIEGEAKISEEEFRIKAREHYRNTIEAIKGVIDDIQLKRGINLEKAKHAINTLVASIQRNRTPLLTLVSLKAHDEYTFSHAVNVAVLTIIQGEALGLDRQMLNDLGISGLLHDVGKLKVPQEILQKPSRLTKEEFEVIKLHPIHGAKILLANPGIPKLACIVAFEHHIKYDLTGYPCIWREQRQLNLGSMLVRIADTYDAMRSNRVYAKEVPPEKTVTEMEEAAGKEFDPVLLRQFIKIIGVYPPGTFVQLETGECGFVVETNPSDPYRPRVKIVLDKDGEKIEEPYEINLIEKTPETGDFRWSIKRSCDPQYFGIKPDEYF